jgi:glycosyltransferase involved in cell wall biosynthesis
VRILYHHRTLADGAEGIHIAEMVQAFRDLRHEVRLSGVTASTDTRGAHPSIHRVRAMLPQPLVEVASLAYNIRDLLEMRRDIESFKPDLVYKRHARFDLAPLFEARRRGIPTVLEVNAVHSAPQRCEFEPLALRRLAERLERRAFELATVIVTVSTPLARQVRSLAAANVVVLPNGANPHRFDVRHADRAGVRARLGLGDRLTIGWAGILREWHGLDLLLEATVALPDARLLVVGDGPARATLEQRAASLGLGGRLVITGRVAYAEMPDYVAAMDIAVVSDERTGVASPMKLLEYMAMSRAVLAPRLENISDIVRHDVDALLFTPGSARDLSNMLRQLAENPGLRNELGQRARATVERERNWRRIAETVLALPGARGRDRVTQPAL